MKFIHKFFCNIFCSIDKLFKFFLMNASFAAFLCIFVYLLDQPDSINMNTKKNFKMQKKILYGTILQIQKPNLT